MSQKEHAIAKPVLNTMFWNESEWSVDTFAAEADTLFTEKKEKGSLSQTDIKTWAQQMIQKYGLKYDISAEEAADLEAYSAKAFVLANLPDNALVFNDFTDQVLKTSAMRDQNTALLKQYAPIAKARCPFLSDDEADVVSHALIDGAITFAGGLSIPSLITSMLGVLYNPSLHGDFTKTYNTPEFLWETVRYYPAVQGVPFARTGTTQREAVFLPTALTDKAVWGEDAFDFKLRDESVYSGNIDVAWAGFASSEDDPANGHNCPGTAMSKAIMLGFMKAFKYTDWEASETPKQIMEGPVTWSPTFSLIHKGA